jgi:hypothetical protein
MDSDAPGSPVLVSTTVHSDEEKKLRYVENHTWVCDLIKNIVIRMVIFYHHPFYVFQPNFGS